MKNKSNSESGTLFERVVSILEKARSNVVWTVNSERVTAYWLIGREIVEDVQRGEERAGFAKEIPGLLRCTEKNDSMARYIPGEENGQIFVSKYKLVLPTLDEREDELIKERFRLEESVAQYGGEW